MSRRWRMVFIALWVVIPTMLVITGAIDLAQQLRLRGGPTAPGVVVAWSRTGYRSDNSCRTVDFRPRGSTQTVRFVESMCRTGPGHVGEQVRVRYDPRHPADAVVAGDAEWVAPAGLIGGGITMSWLGWWAWRRYDPASGTCRTRR